MGFVLFKKCHKIGEYGTVVTTRMQMSAEWGFIQPEQEQCLGGGALTPICLQGPQGFPLVVLITHLKYF